MTHLLYPVRQSFRTARDLTMTLLPHGGQRTSRHNAWASVSADLDRSRSRREAQAAIDIASLGRHEPADPLRA